MIYLFEDKLEDDLSRPFQKHLRNSANYILEKMVGTAYILRIPFSQTTVDVLQTVKKCS